MLETIIPWIILTVFVLIGIDVVLNIQGKLRSRRMHRQMCEGMSEITDLLSEMEDEMTKSEAQTVVVKPAAFKKVAVVGHSGSSKDVADAARKQKNRDKMRVYRAIKKSPKKVVKKATKK